MAAKRHRPGELVTKLRRFDVLAGQAMSRIDAIGNDRSRRLRIFMRMVKTHMGRPELR